MASILTSIMALFGKAGAMARGLHTDSPLIALLVFLAVFLVIYAVLMLFYRRRGQQWQEKRMKQTFSRQLDPLEYFIEGRDLLLMRVSVAILFALMPLFLPQYGVPQVVELILSGLLAAFGYMLPLWSYKLKAHWRQQRFENQILLMLSGIISGLRGGLDFQASILQIASTMPDPMGEALEVVAGEVGMAISLEDALERMYDRFPCEDLRLIVTTVKLALRGGGGTAVVLEKQLEVIRKRREVQGKIKSMTSQGMMEAYFLCASPLFFIMAMYYSDPSLVKPLFTTVRGWKIVGAGLLLDALGFFWLQKLVKIKI